MYKLLNIWRKSFFLYKVYILIKVCMIVKVLNAMQDKTFVDFITFNCRNWTVGTIVADKEWTNRSPEILPGGRVPVSAYWNGFHSFPAADSGLTGLRGFLGIADWGVLKAGAALLRYCFLQFATISSRVASCRYLAGVMFCYICPRFNTLVNHRSLFHCNSSKHKIWKIKFISWHIKYNYI